MKILAVLIQCLYFKPTFKQNKQGFVSVQIENKLYSRLEVWLAAQSSDFCLLFCFQLSAL